MRAFRPRLVHGLLALLVAAVAGGSPVSGQQCLSDFQCGPDARGYNTCLGDTLIMRQRLCLMGRCVEQETGRINCRVGSPAIGGTCQGNVFIASGGNACDALAGRCTQGSTIRISCTRSCNCVGRTLTISTGICSPGSGCGRVVLRCKTGCTCADEPRCTDEPAPGDKAPAGRGADTR